MKLNIINRQYGIVVIAMAVLLLGLTTYTLVSPTTTNANAETITNTAGSTSDYYVSLTSNDTVSLSITPDNNIHTVTDTLTATSNTGSGYKIFVSMSNDDTNSNRLYLNGDTTSSSYLTPTTTTTLDTNSWGVSTDTTENKSYSAMPLLGNELLVKDFSYATPSTTIPVTYGAKADMTSPAGTYKGEIVYSILANSPTNTILSTTTAYTPGGGTLTISTPLMNSLGLDKATPTATVSIGTLVNDTLTDISTCTDPTVGINSNTGIYEVTCNLPAKSAGNYDVVVAYTDGLQDSTTRSYTASSQLTYVTPTISSVSPASRWATGTESITIITNIAKDTPMTVSSATVGDTACTSPSVTNSGNYRAITCTSPQLAAGAKEVKATIVLSGVSTTLTKANAITYDAISISSVSPNTDLNPNGGETITIVLNLSSSTTISNASATVGGTACTSPAITTSGSYRAITCTTPAKAAGTYTVATSFTLNGATASPSLANAVTYKEPALCNVGSGTCMQDIATVCPTLSQHQTRTLTDARDGQQYTIFKAKDGNCWMGENLRYGINPDGTGHPFVAADAALSDNVVTTTDSSTGRTSMLDLTYDATNPNTAGRIKNGTSGMKTADNSADAFSSSGDNYTEPYININQANTAASYDGKTKFGVLYNHCAATGGTVCNNSAMSTDAPGSVCPKGWKLPGMTASATGSGATTDGTVKTYNNLANAYGYNNDSAGLTGMLSYPLNFVRAGAAYDGSLYNRSSSSSSGRGYYLSSTKHTSTSHAYGLSLRYDSGFYVRQSNIIRYNGYSLRCVSS